MATQSNSSKNKAGAGKSGKSEKKDLPMESWVMRNAACFHVTPHRELLENYTAGDFGKVYTITNASLDVVGKGDVRFKLSSGATWILKDVRHVPNGAWSMISGLQLGARGYTVIYYNDVFRVSQGDFYFISPFAAALGPTYLSTSPSPSPSPSQ